MSAYTKDPEFALRWPDFSFKFPDPQKILFFIILGCVLYLVALAIYSKMH